MISSPLRYPGGKAKLFPFFAKLIAHNRLSDVHYCEPYAGGAGLALRLLSTGLVHHVSLNDIDVAVWAFWKAALDYNTELCALVASAELSISEWYKQRDIWRNKDKSDILSLGFSTFYLNRTNRSGIIDGAGPIGGYHQTGNWRIDARFDREKQKDSIRSLVPFKSHISLSCLDALDFLDEKLAASECLTYLDPPYYVKGQKLYRNSYSHNDHVDVMKRVKLNRDKKWIVSYDAAEQIKKIYSDFRPHYYSLSYSAGTVGSGREVIYLSDALSMPQFAGFSLQAA